MRWWCSSQNAQTRQSKDEGRGSVCFQIKWGKCVKANGTTRWRLICKSAMSFVLFRAPRWKAEQIVFGNGTQHVSEMCRYNWSASHEVTRFPPRMLHDEEQELRMFVHIVQIGTGPYHKRKEDRFSTVASSFDLAIIPSERSIWPIIILLWNRDTNHNQIFGFEHRTSPRLPQVMKRSTIKIGDMFQVEEHYPHH